MPYVSKLVMNAGSLAVEVGRLGVTAQTTVCLSRALPGQGLPAAIPQAAMERRGPMVGGKCVAEAASRSCGMAWAWTPRAIRNRRRAAWAVTGFPGSVRVD